MPDVTSEKIVVHCESCAAAFRVPASAAGKRGKCPKCGAVFTVPAPEEEPAAAGGDDLFAGLDTGPAAPALAPLVASRPCASCGAALPGDAIVCTRCGYNSKTGRQAGASGALGGAGAAVAGALGGAARFGGPFMLGTLLSAAAAAIGAAAWCLIAWKTGYEVGYVAWGIGILCGAAMFLGYRDTSLLAGLVAAGMAALGICAGKAGFLYIFLGGLGTDFSRSPRELVTESIAADKATEAVENLSLSENASDAEWDAAEAKAEKEAQADAKKEVAAMTDEQVNQRVSEMRDAEWRFKKQLYFSTFGFVDILFFALAIASAFGIAVKGFGGG